MMEKLLHSWLYSLLLSGCICSIILFLSTDGKLKPFLETGCACIMALTFISPILNTSLQEEISRNFMEWTTIETYFSPTTETISYNQTYMESEYRAYILNEAAFSGIPLSDAIVYTKLNEHGYWVPTAIDYISDFPIADSFRERIRVEFGITEERQIINANSEFHSKIQN